MFYLPEYISLSSLQTTLPRPDLSCLGPSNTLLIGHIPCIYAFWEYRSVLESTALLENKLYFLVLRNFRNRRLSEQLSRTFTMFLRFLLLPTRKPQLRMTGDVKDVT